MNSFWSSTRKVIQPRYDFLIKFFGDYFGKISFSILEISIYKGELINSLMNSNLNISKYDGVDPYWSSEGSYYYHS